MTPDGIRARGLGIEISEEEIRDMSAGHAWYDDDEYAAAMREALRLHKHECEEAEIVMARMTTPFQLPTYYGIIDGHAEVVVPLWAVKQRMARDDKRFNFAAIVACLACLVVLCLLTWGK